MRLKKVYMGAFSPSYLHVCMRDMIYSVNPRVKFCCSHLLLRTTRSVGLKCHLTTRSDFYPLRPLILFLDPA